MGILLGYKNFEFCKMNGLELAKSVNGQLRNLRKIPEFCQENCLQYFPILGHQNRFLAEL